jgi:hypothetical protein
MVGYHLPTYIFMTYLPTCLQKHFLIINVKIFYLNKLTNQMVHYLLVKMTSQMVFILIVKNTTPITLDMLELTCPK